jgi:hypothetical protein
MMCEGFCQQIQLCSAHLQLVVDIKSHNDQHASFFSIIHRAPSSMVLEYYTINTSSIVLELSKGEVNFFL